MKRKGYRKPVQDLAGVRTLVTQDSQRGIPADTVPGASTGSSESQMSPDNAEPRERALPLSEAEPGAKVKTLPQAYFNVPIFTDQAPSGITTQEMRIAPRTRATPGEYTVDPVMGVNTKFDYHTLTRRTMQARMALRVARTYQATFYRKEEAAAATPSKETFEQRNVGTPGRNPERLSPEGPGFERDEKLEWSRNQNSGRKPSTKPDFGFVEQSGGSAKVIPEGKGFVNKMAARIEKILGTIDSEVAIKASTLKPRKRKVNVRQGLWLYDVDKYKVSVKAKWKRKRDTSFRVADIKVKCTCAFWQWQGPEHWGAQDDYLFHSPQGTASKPSIRDPEGKKRVCKHVYAVLNNLKKQSRMPPKG